MVLKPGSEAQAQAIFEKWELDFAVVGRLTDTGRIEVVHNGVVEADIPLEPLSTNAPLYRRPTAPTPKRADVGHPADPLGLQAALEKLIACPDLASRAWVWNQYDTTVQGNTVFRPGQADAALVRLDGTARALAMTTDCTPRWCLADPELGGAHAVAEAWRNISATGATPLAITDNMNFANPQRPEIMGQFASAVMGMRAACLALDFPVVSGNVSLYNETVLPDGTLRAILPTPAIGGVGVIADAARAVGLALKPGLDLVLLGETRGHLGASLWLREVGGTEAGPPPPLDLEAERRAGDFVRAEILAGRVAACHDCSDGGLLVAIAEMAMAGGVGASLAPGPETLPAHAFWFGEDASRYVLAVADGAALIVRAGAAGVAARLLGRTGGAGLTLAGALSISIEALAQANAAWFPTWMEGPV